MKPWTPEEDFYLESITGTLPLCLLTQEYNRFAKKKGFPQRSKNAVKVRINRALGTSRVATEDYVTLSQLSRLLGVSTDRVYRWCHHWGLPYIKLDSTHLAISLESVREWALQNPSRIWGIPKETIEYYLGEDVKTGKRRKFDTSKNKPVRCVETGVIYPSVKDAALAIGRYPQNISEGIRSHWRVSGCYWEYVK